MEELFIGNSIIELEKIDSTNNYANKLGLNSKTVSGTVVYALHQTKGRGQQGNVWKSEKHKNLTFSIILKPDKFLAENQFMLSKIISLGMLDYLESKSQNFSIKWPNDIYHDNKKIAGILIENSIQGSYLSQAIVGIGINLNQEKFNSKIQNPISLKNITGVDYTNNVELNELLNCLNNRYADLINNNSSDFDKIYLDKLFRFNEVHNFLSEGNKFRGKIIGVNTYGQLQIELSGKSVKTFGFKEVEYLF